MVWDKDDGTGVRDVSEETKAAGPGVEPGPSAQAREGRPEPAFKSQPECLSRGGGEGLALGSPRAQTERKRGGRARGGGGEEEER